MYPRARVHPSAVSVVSPAFELRPLRVFFETVSTNKISVGDRQRGGAREQGNAGQSRAEQKECTDDRAMMKQNVAKRKERPHKTDDLKEFDPTSTHR